MSERSFGRLGSFYFFYFATLGALIPYWSLYLEEVGLTPVAIGLVMAVLQGTRVVAPHAWGWLADASGERLRWVRLACLAACLAFAALIPARGLAAIALITAGFAFFWSAALPQFEAFTLERLGNRSRLYSRVRLWGSVGFIITVLGAGPLFDLLPVRHLPAVVLPLFAALFLCTLLLREPRYAPAPQQAAPSVWPRLRHTGVLVLLAACFFSQLGHGPYYGYFSLFLEQHGYSRGVIGLLWALGVVAEIGLFLCMPALLQRFAARRLFLWALGLAALRWLMIAVSYGKISILLPAQALHLASFGLFHAAAIALIQRYFPGRLHGRGQALYSSLFGAGGALGNLTAGYVWEWFGPAWVFGFAAAAAATGFALALLFMSRADPEPAAA